MPNENVTSADIKATAKKNLTVAKDRVEDRVEDIADAVQDNVQETKVKVNSVISPATQKLLVLVGGTLLASALVQSLVNRFRKPELVVVAVPVDDSDTSE